MFSNMKPVNIGAISSQLIAEHPGMRLNAAGKAVPHHWITWAIALLCLPGLLAIFPLPATLINTDGLGQWIDLVRGLGFFAAGLVLWITASLIRTGANPHDKGAPLMAVLFLAPFFAPLAYGFTSANLLRVAPLISTYVFSAPRTVTTPIRFVLYKKPCHRRCLVHTLTGTQGSSYSIRLENYPNFVAPITLYDRPEGLAIQSSANSWPRELPIATFTGRGNWLALRIEHIGPEGAQDGQLAALSSTD